MAATCKHCKKFFAKHVCSAKTHGECDCPKCQGFCVCSRTEETAKVSSRTETPEPQ